MSTEVGYSIWTSDYEPQSFDDVIGNDEIVEAVKHYFMNDNIPNIILSGGNGTCKSTLARLIAKTHLGDKYNRACLRIDGSIHRGKDIITTNPEKKTAEKSGYSGMDIMSFAKTRVTMEPTKRKIIIIYNFEHMTNEAQNALRRIIETYAKRNRFILICNDLNSIIEAIQSRCVCLKTRELDDAESVLLMDTILQKHGTALPQDIKDTICLLSNGDMKKTINYLQMAANIINPTLDKFYQIFNIPPIHVMKGIINDCQQRETQINAYRKMKSLLDTGHNYSDILEIMTQTLARFIELDKAKQIKYLKILAHCYHSAERDSSDIYIYSLLSEFCSI
jgi:DNA polymerase III delta prime subunit